MAILQDHGDGSATIWGEFTMDHENMVLPYFLKFNDPGEFYVICEAGKVPLLEYAKERGYAE